MSVDQNKIFPKVFLLGLLFWVGTNLNAQIVDADTIQSVNISQPAEEEVHSPKKASVYSAILPGLGQAYNKKYWKIPMIYGGFAAFIYFIDWNNDHFQLYKNYYAQIIDTDPNTNDFMDFIYIDRYDLNNSSDVQELAGNFSDYQEVFRRNRDLLIILTVGFYGLNIIDASVDAHLFNFDISDDLTLNWQPSMLNINNQKVYCINCTFNF